MTGFQLFTIVHVLISLVGIGTGFVVMYGFLTGKRLEYWTAIFLTFTILTSVTGFLFPIEHFTPGLAIGILSMLVLGVALVARYQKHMIGPWRTTYVICAIIAQYFNFFVLIVQSFQKVPALAALATQSEAPFLVTQLLALALFVALAIGALIRFRGESMRAKLV
jgi:hypothetical protein